MRAAGKVAVGLHRLLGGRADGMVGIVTYHRVAAHIRGLPKPTHNVSPDRFCEQLRGLLTRRFSVWPLRKVLAFRARGVPIPPRTLVVTFDDGYESVYTHAWPVLRKLNIPATVFVNTAYLDRDAPFPFDTWGVAWQDHLPTDAYRPLSMTQCRKMAAGGLVELGAHTHTHADFRDRTDAFQEDLQRSVDIVRSRFGQWPITFAFPYGGPHLGFANCRLVAAARQTGVLCALTTESVPVDPASDPFQWGRFNAFPWDTSATLAAKVEGWYSWAPKLRQWVAGAVCRRGKDRVGMAGAEDTEPTSADHAPCDSNDRCDTFQEGTTVR